MVNIIMTFFIYILFFVTEDIGPTVNLSYKGQTPPALWQLTK